MNRLFIRQIINNYLFIQYLSLDQFLFNYNLLRQWIGRYALYLCLLVNSFLLLEGFSIEKEEIFQLAAQKNIPIALVLLGDEECPWSHRIEKELLPSVFFRENVGAEAVIWVCSPSRTLNSDPIAQEYKGDPLPAILLLDPKGREFARLDYVAQDPTEFSRHILELIAEFQEICKAVDQGFKSLSEEALQILYLQACKLSTPCFKQVILNQGLKKEKGTFFRLEKYALLLKKLRLRNPEVLKLKKELLSRDPENLQGTHYQMALIEFAKKTSQLKRKDSLDKPLAPLLYYLNRFGKSDLANRWKLELVIAEFLFSKKAHSEALEYAIKAAAHAPLQSRAEILQTIKYMRKEG